MLLDAGPVSSYIVPHPARKNTSQRVAALPLSIPTAGYHLWSMSYLIVVRFVMSHTPAWSRRGIAPPVRSVAAARAVASVVPNDNRVAGGRTRDGVLRLQLEVR